MSEKEHVDHPQHYGGADDPYECIKVIEAVLGKAGYAIWLRGEVLKYTFRIGKKGEPKADAGKLRFYAAELERVHKEFAAAWNTPLSGTAEFVKKWGARHTTPTTGQVAENTKPPQGQSPAAVILRCVQEVNHLQEKAAIYHKTIADTLKRM